MLYSWWPSLFQSCILGFSKGGLRAGGHEASTFIADMFLQLPGHLGGLPDAGDAQAGPALRTQVRGFSGDGHGLAEGPQTMLFLSTTDNAPDTRCSGFPHGRALPISTDTHWVLGFSAVLTARVILDPRGLRSLPSDPPPQTQAGGPRSSLCFLLTGCKARVPRTAPPAQLW